MSSNGEFGFGFCFKYFERITLAAPAALLSFPKHSLFLGPFFLLPCIVWHNVYSEGLLISQRQKGIAGRDEPKEERTQLRDGCGIELRAQKDLALRNVSETAKLTSGHPSPPTSYFPSHTCFLTLQAGPNPL